MTSETSGDLCDLSATEQAQMFRHKEVSARELLESHLRRIDERNPEINAIVALDADVAHARAAELDEAIARRGAFGYLPALVTAHKDLTETADFPTTYGSPVYADNRPARDSHLVARIRAAGAVAVGKTNVPEFGVGSHTFNPVYGTTVNPYDRSRSAGGSSGGAAAALASGMVAVADGSDFGGSLRNPAAWNNVVGFRPSTGVVPTGGPGNAWHPMPIQGPMARNVDDLVLLLGAMSGPDRRDPLGWGHDRIHPFIDPVREPPRRELPRVAWSTDLGGLPVEPEITETLAGLIPVIEHLGWPLAEDEPSFAGADDTFLTLRAFSFSGHADALRPHFDRIKATLRDEIERGLQLSGHEVARAFARMKVLWDRANSFFENYDVLIAPVTQVMPFPVDQEYPTEVNGQPMSTYIEWMMSCCRITAFGLPALSLPAGFSKGLPVGVQLIGKPHGDGELLAVAKALESAISIEDDGNRGGAGKPANL
jgi:amidase